LDQFSRREDAGSKLPRNVQYNVLLQYLVSIHLDQFSHREDGSSKLPRNVGTFIHYTVLKPIRSL
jgi:hypothetical protein